MSQTIGLSVTDYVDDVRTPSTAESAHDSSTVDQGVELYGLVQRIFLNPTKPVSKVVFSGFMDQKSTSGICAAVAGILAKAAGPVCLIEVAEAGGELSRQFGLTRIKPQASCLDSDEPIANFLSCVDGDRLFVLPGSAWQTKNALLAHERAIRARLNELRQQFRFVVVYVPLAASVGTLMLGQLTDGIVLVLEAGRTRRDTAKSVVDGLRASGVAVLAAVLNSSIGSVSEGLNRSL